MRPKTSASRGSSLSVRSRPRRPPGERRPRAGASGGRRPPLRSRRAVRGARGPGPARAPTRRASQPRGRSAAERRSPRLARTGRAVGARASRAGRRAAAVRALRAGSRRPSPRPGRLTPHSRWSARSRNARSGRRMSRSPATPTCCASQAAFLPPRAATTSWASRHRPQVGCRSRTAVDGGTRWSNASRWTNGSTAPWTTCSASGMRGLRIRSRLRSHGDLMARSARSPWPMSSAGS